MFYDAKHSSVFQKGMVQISQMELNRLVKDIEFHKLLHGQYPSNLEELLEDDKLVGITDAAQDAKNGETQKFNYQKIGNKYTLFSSGADGLPNTKDDLYPQINITDSKIGLVRLARG